MSHIVTVSNPLSITLVMFSMLMLVSAMLVANTTLRNPRGVGWNTFFCSAYGRLLYLHVNRALRSTQCDHPDLTVPEPQTVAALHEDLLARLDLVLSGQKDEDVAADRGVVDGDGCLRDKGRRRFLQRRRTPRSWARARRHSCL